MNRNGLSWRRLDRLSSTWCGSRHLLHSGLRWLLHGSATHYLAQLDERELDHKLLIARFAILQVASVAQVHRQVEEARVEARRQLHVLLSDVIVHLKQAHRLWRAGHHQVAHVLRQTVHKVERVEALIPNLLVDEQRLGHIATAKCLVEPEVVVIVEHIQVLDSALVGDVALARCQHLVIDRQRIAHGTVGLLRYHVERGRLGCHALVLADALQLLHDVGHSDARKVIDLATRQDGGDNLLLLGGGENEDGILGRLLKGLEKRIKRRLRQHVNLVDDEHAIPSHLRRNTHLVGEVAYLIHRIVARSIELQDVVGPLLIEGLARLALVARLTVGTQVLTVDGLGKDARTSGLAHTTRAAKQVGMSQLLVLDSCLQRVGQRLLTHHSSKTRWTVLSRRYYIILAHEIHIILLQSTKIIFLLQFYITQPFFLKKSSFSCNIFTTFTSSLVRRHFLITQ